jgi:DNA polymerase elongation subunit (family B)
MLNYTKEKIIDDLKHKQLLTLERQFSTITNKIINEYTRSIIIEKYINEGIIQMNTDKILQEIQDVIVQFRIEEFQRKSLQELEQLQDTILEYFKIPPEWVISEKLHTPSQRSDSKKWVRAPLIPISAYDKYLKYKYKYLKLKEELSKN